MRLVFGRDEPEGLVRRVAVTGIGVVARAGIGKVAFWEGLLAPAPVGERNIEGFDASDLFNPKELRRADRVTQLTVAVAYQALAEAGELEVDPARAGVLVGTGIGGLETLDQQVIVNHEKGPRRVSPFLIPMIMANAGAANMSIRLGWQGPCETTVTACASGTHALGNAGRLVASGRLEVALAIGAESTLIGVARAGFANMTALSQSGISRPFDKERDGFVMAEGAAALVLEEWDRAVARGAHIYGELAGAASSADAFHITAPAPAGSGAAACMELALHDARVSAEEIVHINAHGTSTPLNDSAEAEAINKVFGVPGPPVTSIKGVTGHALGAAGAIEAVSVLLSYEHRLIPPTAGLVDLDPAVNLDVVHPTARPFEPGPVISNSFGFGGHNGCLVFKPASHQQS